jgi:hypothetical protein
VIVPNRTVKSTPRQSLQRTELLVCSVVPAATAFITRAAC